MRAARRILVALLALAVLAVAAAWVVPPLLDWNGYRDTIAALASRKLGQKVTIAGPVRLSLLPVAEISAEQVTLGDGSLSVDALRLEAALGPLLAGRIEPSAVVLQAPRLLVPWPPPPGWLAAPPALPPGLDVQIEEGTALLGVFAVAGVQARATVSETGALALDGHARIAGRDWSFALRLTAFGKDGSAGVNARMQGSGRLAGTSGSFNGQLVGLRTLGGTATLAGPDLSALLPAPAVPFRAQGRLTAADGLVAADDLAIDLGGTPARAAVALRLLPEQRLDFSLAIGRLDLAAWLRPLLHPPAGGDWGLPVGLDLSAEAAELAGATLRRLRCAFDLSPGTVDLREAAAILPGEATLALTGRISRGAAAAFAGAAKLDAPDLPATAGWAARGLGLDAAWAARLPRGGTLAGPVAATANGVTLERLAGTLDGGAAEGGLALRFGPQPALDVMARLARLDLDAWLPSGLPGWSALGALSGAGSLSLDVQAAQAALHGLALREVAIRAEAAPGRLAVQRIAGRLAGARLAVSGAIGHDGALADGRLDLAAEPAADLIPAVAALGGPGWLGRVLQRAGALHVTLSGQGAPDAIAGHAVLEAAGGSLVADPVVDVANGTVLASVRLAHPDAAALLTRLGWLPAGEAVWLGAGKLDVQADVSAGAERLAAPRLDVQAGALQGRAALTADWQGPLPRLTGRIEAATLPLPWPAGEGAAPLPFALLNGWEAALEVSADRVLAGPVRVVTEAHARVGVAEGVLGVGGFTARLGGGTVTASAAIDGAATPPTLQADASLSGAVIAGGVTGGAVDLLSGTAAARLRAAAAGYSLPALAATLQGEATLDVTQGVLAGFDLGRLRAALLQAAGSGSPPEVAAALDGGRTGFDTLHAAAELSSGGLALREAQLAGAEGQATASGIIALGGGGIDVRLGLRPVIAGGPEVGLRLTGPAAAPDRTPELSFVLRWLSHG